MNLGAPAGGLRTPAAETQPECHLYGDGSKKLIFGASAGSLRGSHAFEASRSTTF